MSLITYESLSDGTPITANIFNERFGQIIAAINGGLDQTNFAAGGIPATALANSVFEKFYPIGSIYYNATDNTNPSALFGFGAWEPYALGKVIVGYDATDTDFNGAEKTGGAKTTTLTTGQLPAHAHSVNPPATGTNWTGDHAHQTHIDWNVANGSGEIVTGANSDPRGNNTSTNGGHAHTVDIQAFNSANAGSGEAHSNMQPFTTAYAWKRTA